MQQLWFIDKPMTQHVSGRSLRLCSQEHTRYIKYNNPPSAYLSQPARVWTHWQNNDPPLASQQYLPTKPYEQFFIHSLHKEGKLIQASQTQYSN